MATKPTVPKEYKAPEYKSKYQGQVDTALEKVTGREGFSYDPLKDANYKALEKIYDKRGEQAAKNTMADAASLNGGYGTSWAATASAQARNDYNQELAAQIPALADAAYNRYVNDYNMDMSSFNALLDAENMNYGKFRDTVGDAQWKYGMDFDKYGTALDMYMYEKDREYQKARDKVADSQWTKEFNLAKKGSRSGGGSSRGTRGGGGSYSGGSSGGGGSMNDDFFNSLYGAAQDLLGGNNKPKKKGAVKASKQAAKSIKKKASKKK